MLEHDPFDYIPGPTHTAIRKRPRNVAPLYVHHAEWQDLDAIRSQHGETHIVDVRPIPFIPAAMVEVLCRDSHTVLALMVAWGDYGDTSPHRPHTDQERSAWSNQHNLLKNNPPDWAL